MAAATEERVARPHRRDRPIARQFKANTLVVTGCVQGTHLKTALFNFKCRNSRGDDGVRVNMVEWATKPGAQPYVRAYRRLDHVRVVLVPAVDPSEIVVLVVPTDMRDRLVLYKPWSRSRGGGHVMAYVHLSAHGDESRTPAGRLRASCNARFCRSVFVTTSIPFDAHTFGIAGPGKRVLPLPCLQTFGTSLGVRYLLNTPSIDDLAAVFHADRGAPTGLEVLSAAADLVRLACPTPYRPPVRSVPVREAPGGPRALHITMN